MRAIYSAVAILIAAPVRPGTLRRHHQPAIAAIGIYHQRRGRHSAAELRRGPLRHFRTAVQAGGCSGSVRSDRQDQRLRSAGTDGCQDCLHRWLRALRRADGASSAGDTAAMLALGGTPGAPLSLPVALAGQNVSVTLTGGVAASIDATQALTSAIAAGQATFWLRGPLASQARVDVPVVGAMHIIFDITAYSDGAVITDATVANDYAMGSVGGTRSYTATIRRNGTTVFTSPATHPLSVSAVALDQ